MDNNLKRDVDKTVEQGKAETREMRAEVEARADEARADIDARADQAEGEVRQHFDEVRDEATQELNEEADAAKESESTIGPEREGAEDRLVQLLDKARDREATRDSQGILGRIKSIFTGGRS